jgi:hypothetical protein
LTLVKGYTVVMPDMAGRESDRSGSRQTAYIAFAFPIALCRLVLGLLAVVVVAGELFAGATTFKFDRDPDNDTDGTCVLVVSVVVLSAGLLHSLGHSRPLSRPSFAPCVCGIRPVIQRFRSLRTVTYPRFPAVFQRMV